MIIVRFCPVLRFSIFQMAKIEIKNRMHDPTGNPMIMLTQKRLPVPFLIIRLNAGNEKGLISNQLIHKILLNTLNSPVFSFVFKNTF